MALKFNFSSASGRDEIVYGSARPGAGEQRCFDAKDQVKNAEVDEWVAYMKTQGIRRVVSLLTASEIGTYERPPIDIMKEQGLQATAIDAATPGACDELLVQLDSAFTAKEKVVVHCWGGGGRTGRALAAWLSRHYGLAPEVAAAEVTAHAKEVHASRRSDAESLAVFLGVSA